MAISENNSKRVGPNVSLRPIADCRNCKLCAKDCYALKSYRQYPSTRQSWNTNSRLARKHPEMYFGMIRSYLTKKSPQTFRWHVAGDILDQYYLEQMKGIAREFPSVAFLCFTKRFDLSYEGIPSNLSIVFSRWPGDCPENPGRLPNAWLQNGNETRIPETAIPCHGTEVDRQGCVFQHSLIAF